MRLVGRLVAIDDQVELRFEHFEIAQLNVRTEQAQDADARAQAFHLRVGRLAWIFEPMNHHSGSFGFEIHQPPVKTANLDASPRGCFELCNDAPAHQVFKFARIDPKQQERRRSPIRAIRSPAPFHSNRRFRRGGAELTGRCSTWLIRRARSRSTSPTPDSSSLSITSTSPCLRRLSSQLPNITFTCSSRRISSMREDTALKGGTCGPFGILRHQLVAIVGCDLFGRNADALAESNLDEAKHLEAQAKVIFDLRGCESVGLEKSLPAGVGRAIEPHARRQFFTHLGFPSLHFVIAGLRCRGILLADLLLDQGTADELLQSSLRSQGPVHFFRIENRKPDFAGKVTPQNGVVVHHCDNAVEHLRSRSASDRALLRRPQATSNAAPRNEFRACIRRFAPG